MTIFDRLKQVVREMSEEAQVSHINLSRQLGEVDTWREQIKAEIEVARGVLQRLANFPIRAGSEYLCPCCWAAEEKISPLKPASSETDNAMLCRVCHFEIVVATRDESAGSRH